MKTEQTTFQAILNECTESAEQDFEVLESLYKKAKKVFQAVVSENKMSKEMTFSDVSCTYDSEQNKFRDAMIYRNADALPYNVTMKFFDTVVFMPYYTLNDWIYKGRYEKITDLRIRNSLEDITPVMQCGLLIQLSGTEVVFEHESKEFTEKEIVEQHHIEELVEISLSNLVKFIISETNHVILSLDFRGGTPPAISKYLEGFMERKREKENVENKQKLEQETS